MVIRDGAQGTPDCGVLEEESERGDERAGDCGGDQIELVDEHPADN